MSHFLKLFLEYHIGSYPHMNDITEGINSQMKLFADDCLIFRAIHSTADHQVLEQDLTTLSKWVDK